MCVRVCCGGVKYKSDITGSIGANLASGNIAALSDRGNIQDHVAKAQAATQAKEAAMIQVCAAAAAVVLWHCDGLAITPEIDCC